MGPTLNPQILRGHEQRPFLGNQEGLLDFSSGYGEDPIPCDWNIGMLLVVCYLEIPRPLRAFYPLSSYQWGQGKILFIELDVPHYGVEIRFCQGLSDLIRLQRTCPFQDIGRQLKGGIIKTERLGPLSLGIFRPEIAQFSAGIPCQ